MSDSVGSASVDVVPDARGWAEKLRAQIRDFVATVRVELDTAGARADMESLRAEMAAVGQAHGSVDIDTAASEARVEELILKEDDAARTRHGRVDVDTSNGLSGLQGITSSLGLIPTLAITAGSALIPLGAALAGLAGAFGASALAGGGGVGAFAASAVGNISAFMGAQKNLATQQSTAQSALQSQQAAVFAVANAEASLSSAQRQQQAAQQNLTQARAAARAELASLTDQIRGAQLAEGDASISLREARLHLQQILANPTSSQLDIDAARQQLKDAEFQLDQARKRRKDTQEQARQERAAGVAGNAQVVAAQQQLTSANASVASAHRSVAQARAQEAEATTKLQEAEQKLGATQAILGTPAAKEFAAALKEAKTAWGDFLKATADATFGTAGKALGVISGLLPTIAQFSNIAARAISDLLGEFGRFTHSTEAKGLAEFFERFEGPAIRQFGHIMGGFALGLIGLFKAFAPLGLELGGALERMAGGFADLGLNADKSKGFQSFLDYVHQVGPRVAQTFRDLGKAIGHVIEALAPIGSGTLTVIDRLAQAFNSIPIPVLTQIGIGIIGIVAGLKVLSPILSIVTGILAAPEIAAAVGIVIALGGAFYLLYQHSKPFRNLIHDVGDYFKSTWLPKIKEAAHDLLPALRDAFHDVTRTIRENKPFLEVIGKALVAITSVAVIAGLRLLAFKIREFGASFEIAVKGARLLADVTLTVFRQVLRGLATFVDAAARELGIFVDTAAAAFGWVPHVGGKIKAAQTAFHQFTDGIVNNLNGAADRLQRFQDQIDGVGRSHPAFKVTAQTLAAQRSMEALQRYRINDKTFTIKGELELERAVGPGGGMGRPVGGGDGGGAARGGTTIKVGTVQAHDYDDFLRQMQRRQHQAALSSVGP